jgi:hypothetical protein
MGELQALPTGEPLLRLFSEAVGRIEAEYPSLGHHYGWRFLATPRRTLVPRPPVAFLTEDPGSESPDPNQGLASCEGGSAYVHEAWPTFAPGEHPLQRQVRLMFEWLAVDPDGTLSAYFIPFRSATRDTTESKQSAYDFAVGLWGRILAEVHPRLTVCLGGHVEQGLHEIWGRPDRVSEHDVGWGEHTARVSAYPAHVLLRLPHLARFSVFGRSAAEEPLRALRRAIEAELAARPPLAAPPVARAG